MDEIQYFNKKQQQTLLEFIENGSITLIASTTENPYFYVYNAILSRSTVFEFKPVEPEEVVPRRRPRIPHFDRKTSAKKSWLGRRRDLVYRFRLRRRCTQSNERGRACARAAVRSEDEPRITMELAEQLTQRSAMRYDRDGDAHYDILSAFQKSMRGSDPDAALHYLARLLEAGDLASACRRLDGVRLRRRRALRGRRSSPS